MTQRGTSLKIGIAGLGQMGKPIAVNLRKAGLSLLAVGRRPESLADLARLGAATASDPCALADVDVILLCLSDDASVRDVLFTSGLADRLGASHVIVDLSTLTYKGATGFAAELAARGTPYLDAPISGMEARAVEGTLTIMVGGDTVAFERVRPLLAHIGTTVLHLGPSGSGQLAKLINQLLFDINAAALAELLPFAAAMGLDPTVVGQVVNSGTGRSHASEFFIPRILAGRFSDGYAMSKAYKDLVSGAELAVEHCVPLPVLAAATATYQTALRHGHGDQDKGGMVRVFEDLLGATFRTRTAKSPDQRMTSP